MTAFRLGLTGSIGMGKSTTAAMFAEQGIPVWDADAAVHRLYAAGQTGAQAVAALFPTAIATDGSVDRAILRGLVAAEPAALDRLNAAIHPLVSQDRDRFLAANETQGIVLLDIPLLYESGLERLCDAVAVVTAPAEVQKARVMARPGMTEATLTMILSRQMPDAEKRARADYIIQTTTLDSTRAAVKELLSALRRRIADA